MDRKLSYGQIGVWTETLVRDKLAWARDVKLVTDAGKLQAFEAGVRQGFADCIATLRLHGFIQTGDRSQS